MLNKLNRFIYIARGLEKADLVLKNAHVFNVFLGEFVKSDVAIANGVIAGIGEYRGKREIDLTGKYLTPGFIDAHVHIESSMLNPQQYAKAVVPMGTTVVVADPLGIANVCGIGGVKYMLKATEESILSFFFMIPSRVPSSNLENAGAKISVNDTIDLIYHPRILGLGEMMNYNGILNCDPNVLNKIEVAREKRVDGCAPGLTGNDLMAYVASGIDSDHGFSSVSEFTERLGAGMHVMLHSNINDKFLLKIAARLNDRVSRFCMLATNVRSIVDLESKGHINGMIKRIIAAGVPVETALQMATINTAQYFNMHDHGAIAPNYKADIVVFDDLKKWQPSMVIKDGDIVAENGKLIVQETREPVDDSIMRYKINIADLSPDSFAIHANGNIARVIGIGVDQTYTKALEMPVTVKDGKIIADTSRDILKMAVLERHNGLGTVGKGLVHGFGLKYGALATTVAHNSHNLIVIGVDDSDMLRAVNEIKRINGGIVIVRSGNILGSLAMPLAGIMSDSNVNTVASKLKMLRLMAYSLGVKTCFYPFEVMSFLSLPIVPELKLTDMGLVDVINFDIVPIMVDNKQRAK